MNKTIKVISRGSIFIHLSVFSILSVVSVFAIHASTIALRIPVLNYISEHVDQDSASEPEVEIKQPEQKDTFVPQPNRTPLFTRGSSTR